MDSQNKTRETYDEIIILLENLYQLYKHYDKKFKKMTIYIR